jgi:hypothetical protein
MATGCRARNEYPVLTGNRAALAFCAIVLSLAAAAPAQGAYEYVGGTEQLDSNQGVCPGIGNLATPGYYRNEVGRNPRSNEPFYLEIKLYFVESFDCAASWTGIRVSLPTGLVPSTGTNIVCQRFVYGSGASDGRINTNCPAQPVATGTPGLYSLDPKSTVHPEYAAFGRKYWFQGYDNQTSNTYRTMRLLIPVQATGAMTNAPVTFTMQRFDSAVPWQATVNVTTTGGAPPSGGGGFVKPVLSVQNGAGQVLTSPIGVQFPFSVARGSSNFAVSENTVVGTNVANPPFASCGEGATGFDFNADTSFTELLGNFADYLGGAACDLKPATQYTTEICSSGTQNGTTADLDSVTCINTTYTTPSVRPEVTIAEDAGDSRIVVLKGVLHDAWPAGNLRVKLTKPGQSEAMVGNQTVTRNAGELTGNAINQTNLTSWQVHTVRACFLPSAGGSVESCGAAKEFTPGALTAPEPSMAPGTATFSGIALRSPVPALTVQIRMAKAADVAGLSAIALPVVATAAVTANPGVGTSTVPDIVVSDLASATRYAYAVCVNVSGDATPEDCTPGAGFTSATIPAPDTGGDGGGGDGGGGGGGTTTTPTTSPPPASGGDTPPALLPAATIALATKAVAAKIDRRTRRLTIGTVTCAVAGCNVTASLAGRKLSELRAVTRIVTLATTTGTLKTVKATRISVRLSKALLRKLRSGRRARSLRTAIAVSAAGRSSASQTGTLKVLPR